MSPVYLNHCAYLCVLCTNVVLELTNAHEPCGVAKFVVK